MKTTFTTTALILATGLFAGSAFAADAGPLTREQVQASVLQARADGSLTFVNEGVKNALASARKASEAPSSLTRATVSADFQAAKAAGNVYSANEPGDMRTAQTEPLATRERTAVRAEAVFAAHHHEQEFGG